MFGLLAETLGRLTRDIVEAGDTLITDVSNIGDNFNKGYEKGMISTPVEETDKPTPSVGVEEVKPTTQQ